jgi:hypothetical protein
MKTTSPSDVLQQLQQTPMGAATTIGTSIPAPPITSPVNLTSSPCKSPTLGLIRSMRPTGEMSHIGSSIILKSSCSLILNNVLHIPTITKNLIYVNKFTLDNDIFIEFHPFYFLIKDQKTRKVLLHGPCKCGLYPLPLSAINLRHLILNVTRFSIDHWHNHLGHPTRDIVIRIIRENKLSCASLDSPASSICDPCLGTKACQLPYSLSSSCSTAPLELIHSDVWGSMIQSFGHKKYYVSFINNYSKFT